MAKQTIKTVFQFRRDTTENWELYKDIIPAAGEPCYDINLKTFRIGDGETTYENLPVIGGVENIDDLQAAVEQLQTQVGETNIAETVSELQTVVEQKLDAGAVEELETELKTYIDEQIKTVESTNIDDGEI